MRRLAALQAFVLGSAAAFTANPVLAQTRSEAAQGTVILAAFPGAGLDMPRLNQIFDAARLRLQALPHPAPLQQDDPAGSAPRRWNGAGGAARTAPAAVARTIPDPVPIPKETPAAYRRTFRILLSNPVKTDRYDRYLDKWAGKFGLDARLLKAITAAESEFSPRAHSPRGARGLMQVMPLTGEGVGVSRDRLWDPEQNIRAGAAYLAKLFSIAWRRYKLKGVAYRDAPSWVLERVIAAYNAGPRAFFQSRWCAQTRHYVRKVMLYHGSGVAELRGKGRTLREWLAEPLLALRD